MTKQILLFICIASLAAFPQTKEKPADDPMKDCPMHAAHTKQDHYAAVDERGDKAMGFSHEATMHHFRMTEDGGVIEATAKDEKDVASIAQIRAHMQDIAKMFTAGNFDIPHFIHGEDPAGVAGMKKLGSQIKYQYEELPNGARVRIATNNAEALKSIREFMNYQVSEHRTGDDTAEHQHAH
jgi:hypothetical protein